MTPEQTSDTIPLEHIYIEPRVDSPSPPAVIVLHGRGADEHDLIPLARQLPDELSIISLRAPKPLGPGFTWYDLDLSRGGLHASQPDDADFDRSLELLFASIAAATEVYDLDDTQIGLLGFSQGAILSLGALSQKPSILAWVVGLHGYLPARYDEDDLISAAGIPVFLGAGAHDEVIPPTRGEDAAERLEAAGVPVTFRTYQIGHGTSAQEMEDVVSWVDNRLDHD